MSRLTDAPIRTPRIFLLYCTAGRVVRTDDGSSGSQRSTGGRTPHRHAPSASQLSVGRPPALLDPRHVSCVRVVVVQSLRRRIDRGFDTLEGFISITNTTAAWSSISTAVFILQRACPDSNHPPLCTYNSSILAKESEQPSQISKPPCNQSTRRFTPREPPVPTDFAPIALPQIVKRPPSRGGPAASGDAIARYFSETAVLQSPNARDLLPPFRLVRLRRRVVCRYCTSALHHRVYCFDGRRRQLHGIRVFLFYIFDEHSSVHIDPCQAGVHGLHEPIQTVIEYRFHICGVLDSIPPC